MTPTQRLAQIRAKLTAGFSLSLVEDEWLLAVATGAQAVAEGWAGRAADELSVVQVELVSAMEAQP